MRLPGPFALLAAAMSPITGTPAAASEPATSIEESQPAAQGPSDVPRAPGIFSRQFQKATTFADLPAPKTFVSHHVVRIGSRSIRYRTCACESYISTLSGEPVARFFSFDYIKEGPVETGRPVLFIFNGGPGSSSVWLHMGVLGPKRVRLSKEINPSAVPPFAVVDNPASVLDVADLVFIDPVGTGFSHAVGNAKDSDFADIAVDADSVARFIENWLTRNERWNAPKYVLGESYGTIRAAVLSRALMAGPLYGGVMRGITLDGVILVGSAFTDRRTDGKPSDPSIRAARALPAMAATAWYHRRIDRSGKSLAETVDAANRFAETDYLAALRMERAGKLVPALRDPIVTRLASLTGLSPQTWIDAGLVISSEQFSRTILADRGLQTGIYDSRYTLPIGGSGGDPVSDDPAMARYVPGFIAGFHMMLTRDLAVQMPIPYTAITFGPIAFGWNYARSGVTEGPNLAVDLAVAMRRNPAMRVMVASGYYDQATTAANAMADIREAGLPLARVEFRNYSSGHMVYLGGTAPLFADDVRAFLRAGSAIPQTPNSEASTYRRKRHASE